MSRINIAKTYKIYIGGKFPRTESGRTYEISGVKGEFLANACLSSRKDLRNAVVEAEKAFKGWCGRSAYNKGQILYRIAEIMEGRKDQLIDEMTAIGMTRQAATKEVDLSIDRIVYFAGWTDKVLQVFSTVNPVESSHFNFSFPEPTGIVGIIAPEEKGLLGLVSLLIPAIAGGNTVVMLASKKNPLSAITFAEILHTSDVPGGVVNILTGDPEELSPTFGTHMNINAVIYGGSDKKIDKQLAEDSAVNVKRYFHKGTDQWNASTLENPYTILDTMEIKTTWHPVGT